MAAFLGSTIRSTLSRALGGGPPGFGYAVGEKETGYDGIWSLHKGSKKEDNSPVSVFVFDCVKQKDRLPLARNAFKKSRTIRHPELLRYIDGVETETNIYIATDPVTALAQQLEKKPGEDLIALGLYKVATAIRFLNVDCGVVHGNVRVSSVFTNKAGEWKLGGFEVMSSLKEESPPIFSLFGLLPDSHRYSSPEVRRDSIHCIKNFPIGAFDAWQYACLIYETFNSHLASPEQLLNGGQIPQDMYNEYRNFCMPDPRSRLDCQTFVERGLPRGLYFGNELIAVDTFLDNLNIKDQREKDAFFRNLDAKVEHLPPEYSKYKILPELTKALEYGAGGAKVLGSIVKIGALLSPEEYDRVVMGSVVKMFAAPDRAIRMSLLENLDSFIDRMDKKTINDKVFPHLALGFTDAAPPLREATVKSVLLLIPKLSDRIINNELLRYLAKCQMDEEPGIRTNTTICLGKIAKSLNVSTQRKVLVSAFSRSLRDPFVHARKAGLMSLDATVDLYSPEEIASKVIPSVASVLLDPEKPVRTQAFSTLNVFIQQLGKVAASMPDTAATQAQPGNAVTATGNPVAASAAGEGWAGWAVSSLTSKLSKVALEDAGVSGEMMPAAVPVPQPPVTTAAGNAHAPAASEDGWGGFDIKSQAANSMDEDASSWEPLQPKPAPQARPAASASPGPSRAIAGAAPTQLVSNPARGALDFANDWANPSPRHPPAVSDPPFTSSFGVASPSLWDGGGWGGTGGGATSSSASGMQLTGDTPLNLDMGWGPEDVSPIDSPSLGSSNSATSREGRQLELNRKREERRQRMKEAKDRRGNALGARRI